MRLKSAYLLNEAGVFGDTAICDGLRQQAGIYDSLLYGVIAGSNLLIC